MTKREIIAKAFWEGGKLTAREPWGSLEWGTREALLGRADAVIAALSDRPKVSANGQ